MMVLCMRQFDRLCKVVLGLHILVCDYLVSHMKVVHDQGSCLGVHWFTSVGIMLHVAGVGPASEPWFSGEMESKVCCIRDPVVDG